MNSFKLIFLAGLGLSVYFLSSCATSQEQADALDSLSGADTIQVKLSQTVATESDLPECTSGLKDQFFFVLDDSSFQLCNGQAFLRYALSGNQTLANSCTIESNDDEKSLVCSDGTSAVLSDGLPGKDGIDGTDGVDGVNGDNGTDGANGEDGIDGANGADGDVGQPGTPGTNGTPGIDGKSCDLADDGFGTITQTCGSITTSWPMAQCNILLFGGGMNSQKFLAKVITPFSSFGQYTYDPDQFRCFDGSVLGMCGNTEYNALDQFCDTRDNQLYDYSVLGNQVWMTENLNYKGSGFTPSTTVQEDGVYYSWLDAKATPSLCPEGWSLPSIQDYSALSKFIGNQFGTGGVYTVDDYAKAPGEWTTTPPLLSFFSFGFFATPSGYKLPHATEASNRGVSAHYWTATGATATEAYSLMIVDEGDLSPNDLDFDTSVEKSLGLSVRCVRSARPSEQEFWPVFYDNLETLFQN